MRSRIAIWSKGVPCRASAANAAGDLHALQVLAGRREQQFGFGRSQGRLIGVEEPRANAIERGDGAAFGRWLIGDGKVQDGGRFLDQRDEEILVAVRLDQEVHQQERHSGEPMRAGGGFFCGQT